jgi:hypothetical protein
MQSAIAVFVMCGTNSGSRETSIQTSKDITKDLLRPMEFKELVTIG